MKIFKNKFLFIPIIASILSLCTLILFTYFPYSKNTNKLYNEFISDINNNNIKKVEINTSSKLKIELKNGKTYLTENPKSQNFKENLLKKDINIVENSSQPLEKTIPSLILTISILFIVYFTFIKKKVTSNFSSLDTEDFSNPNKNLLNFNSLAGNEEAKESVKDIVDFLKSPEKYEKYGARMPKGIILYGEPGTGKTLLAKAVAGEANVPFYAVSGSDFVQMYVGVGAARIRSLFKKAKTQGKALIFIDEIDAIGKKRDSSKSSGGSDERDQTLNALLTEMSGFAEKEGVVVIAATNRLDILDSALLRPGRFDRHIEVSLPDLNARKKIIYLYLKNKPHINLNIESLAEKTACFSGAKLENLINEAAILAAKTESKSINDKHIDIAFSTVLAGHEKIDKNFNKSDLKITAYHEAGHALVSHLKLPFEKISKVTIIPTSKGAGGYTLTIPKDSSYKTLEYLKNKIMVLLGGRAAEEIIFGKENITTGAYSDLSHVTNLILNMITEYGMGESLGLLKLSNLGSLANGYSNKAIEECKLTLDLLYKDTKELLLCNINLLNLLSDELLKNETLNLNQINNLLSNKTKNNFL